VVSVFRDGGCPILRCGGHATAKSTPLDGLLVIRDLAVDAPWFCPPVQGLFADTGFLDLKAEKTEHRRTVCVTRLCRSTQSNVLEEGKRDVQVLRLLTLREGWFQQKYIKAC